MKTLFFIFLSSFLFTNLLAQQVLPAAVQIEVALLAAPEELREEASVLGYNEQGELILLRKGTNAMICLADDPKVKGLNVACYHKDLEPFMKRGRELKEEGKVGKEIEDIRTNEVKAGSLLMPESSTALYVLTAKEEDYNKENGVVKNTYLRYVVYIPFATAEATGLPLRPHAPGMPWIMDPGTPHAHIMITPPVK